MFNMEGMEGVWVSLGLSGLWLTIGVVVWILLRDRRRRREERREKLQRMLDEARASGADTEDIAILEKSLREID